MSSPPASHNYKAAGAKPIRAFIAAQFLGAFNDNAFKTYLIMIATSPLVPVDKQASFITLITALFTIPFLIFSSYAGFLADRFSKQKILVAFKFVEFLVMLFAWFAFYYHSWWDWWGILGALFLLGAHSAFFSPSKYGILPELSTPEEISYRNGVLELTTFIAIISGQAIAGFLYPVFANRLHDGAFFFMAIALLGLTVAVFIPKTPAAHSEKKFEINFLKEVFGALTEMKTIPGLRLTVLGMSYFWFLGAFMQMLIPLFSQGFGPSPEHPYVLPILLVALSLGVGSGSFFAGKWSNHKIEFGLLPLGSLLIGLFCILFSFMQHCLWGSSASLFFLGFGGGLFIIPLTSYLQSSPPDKVKGRMISTSNFFSFTGVFISAGFFYLLNGVFHFSAPQMTLVIAMLSLGVTLYVSFLLPGTLFRFMAWMLTHWIYRVRIVGVENLPKEGPALLVCNHISYADPAFLIASTSRFIRFLMFKKFENAPFLGWLSHAMKVIPIDSEGNPKEIIRSLRTAKEGLLNGDLVAIFPEGQISRTGNLLRFKSGMEYILKGKSAPIIPIHLDRVWGSIFSFERKRFFYKWPQRIPYPITVSVGEPLPATTPAFLVREKIQELGANAFPQRYSEKLPLHETFVWQAKKGWRKKFMADSSGKHFSRGQSLVATYCISREILRLTKKDEEQIGVLFPPSCAGALVNLAIFFAGKIPVHLNFTGSQASMALACQKADIKTILTSRLFLEKISFLASGMKEEMHYMEDFLKPISLLKKIWAALLMSILPASWILSTILRKSRKKMDDLATILFSSGSTGIPKGVMLSHGNILSNIEGLRQVLETDEKDTIVGCLPFFHSFGYTGTLSYPMVSDCSVFYHTNPMDFKEIGVITEREKATLLMATPTFLQGYLRRCSAEQFKTLKHLIVGAEKLKETLASACFEKFGLTPCEGYGCTECSPIVSLNIPDFEGKGLVGETITQVGTKKGSIGHPIPGVAVKVVDPTSFQALPCGHPGLLLVKGPNVMIGYLKEPQMTKDAMYEGWYKTGDIAKIDEDGFITITDRLSRFSKIGGEMVPHIKVEEELHNILNTNETLVVVVGIPDESKGEKLAVLHLKLSMSIPDLWKKLCESGMPNLWIPKKDQFFEIPEIPLLGSGKLDIKAIKTMAMRQICG